MNEEFTAAPVNVSFDGVSASRTRFGKRIIFHIKVRNRTSEREV